jgi:hypothetical protein
MGLHAGNFGSPKSEAARARIDEGFLETLSSWLSILIFTEA